MYIANVASAVLSALMVVFSVWRLSRKKKNYYLIEITGLWVVILLADLHLLISGK